LILFTNNNNNNIKYLLIFGREMQSVFVSTLVNNVAGVAARVYNSQWKWEWSMKLRGMRWRVNEQCVQNKKISDMLEHKFNCPPYNVQIDVNQFRCDDAILVCLKHKASNNCRDHNSIHITSNAKCYVQYSRSGFAEYASFDVNYIEDTTAYPSHIELVSGMSYRMYLRHPFQINPISKVSINESNMSISMKVDNVMDNGEWIYDYKSKVWDFVVDCDNDSDSGSLSYSDTDIVDEIMNSNVLCNTNIGDCILSFLDDTIDTFIPAIDNNYSPNMDGGVVCGGGGGGGGKTCDYKSDYNSHMIWYESISGGIVDCKC